MVPEGSKFKSHLIPVLYHFLSQLLSCRSGWLKAQVQLSSLYLDWLFVQLENCSFKSVVIYRDCLEGLFYNLCYITSYNPKIWLDQDKRLAPKHLKSKGITGNPKGGSITVQLTSCFTGLESAVWQLTIFAFICKTGWSQQVKQEVNSTVILYSLGISLMIWWRPN